MPTYEYLCKACRHEWTTEQRISESALKECPKCHAPKAERQISAGNFILKGGGWYADAYSSKKPDKAETKPDAKTETKSEAKPEKADKKETKAADAPAKAPKAPSVPPKSG